MDGKKLPVLEEHDPHVVTVTGMSTDLGVEGEEWRGW
jgi:hypothetical protein